MKKNASAHGPQELIDDIRASLTNTDLMDKYGLTVDQLAQAIKRLYLKGLITGSELEERIGTSLSDDEIADLIVDLKLGLFYDEIKEKYGLSETGLDKAFKVIAARGLASEGMMHSNFRAVNPREAVQDLLAYGSQERLKRTYGLSDEELSQLFISLVDRSFISPDDFSEWHGGEPPVTEPPRVMVYEATGEFQASLVEALLREADIKFLRRVKRGHSPWSISGLEDPVQYLVRKADAEKARRLLYELQQVEPRFIGEIRCEECELTDFDSWEFEPGDEENSETEVPDEEPHEGPDLLVQILGWTVLCVLLAYVFGWIKF